MFSLRVLFVPTITQVFNAPNITSVDSSASVDYITCIKVDPLFVNEEKRVVSHSSLSQLY